MRFLVSGHTGFKGAWLTFLLTELGHEVVGVSLPPREGSIYHALEIERRLSGNYFHDLSEWGSPSPKVGKADFSVHLAAQPIVIEGWKKPAETFATNVSGTLQFLQMSIDSMVADALVVTTDKVYQNSSAGVPFDEQSPLGGADPYSSSKALADTLSRELGLFLEGHLKVIVARGGNVIGGGDDSNYRLVPDIERALRSGSALKVRNPSHVRPWQHVTDCLSGYLQLLRNDQVPPSSAWNIGPDTSENDVSVAEFLELYRESRGRSFEILSEGMGFEEHQNLRLDVSKAKATLGFSNSMTQRQAITRTAVWHRSVESKTSTASESCLDDIEIASDQLPNWLK